MSRQISEEEIRRIDKLHLSIGLPTIRGTPVGSPIPDKPVPGLRDFLAIEAWAGRDIPPPDRLLGDLVTTKTRMFLVGRTGLGKTMLGFGLACGMASGDGFLHWRASRAARVLYLDGEMPDELIKARSIDALRRAGIVPKPGHLMIYSRDTEEEFVKQFPDLGPMPPLNTPAGHQWVLALLASIGDADVVIFDNVMSLVEGDQKDEMSWSAALPLVQALTGKRIGQIWLDHTGHNGDHQYGTSTKSWRAGTVGIMSPISKDERCRGELAFRLSFDHPGKARRRTPENWRDFETRTIRLADDLWRSERGDGNKGRNNLPPSRMVFHDALVAAVVRHPTGHNRTTLEAWEAQCIHHGLIDPPPAEGMRETSQQWSVRYRGFRTAKSALRAANWIVIDGSTVINLRGTS